MKSKLFILVCLTGLLTKANVRLPQVFSDGMVLQQNTKVNLWGWAAPGEEVTIVASWKPQDTLKVKGNRYAKWKIQLPTPKAGGPYELKFAGYNTLQLKDILH